MPAVAMVARSQSPRNAHRGSGAKRRGGTRADRDGDVSMDIAIKGRGRVGKSTKPANSSNNGRDLVTGGGRAGVKSGILSNTARGAILRQAAKANASTREPRTVMPTRELVELKVTGWNKSKAASDVDGGVSSLIQWMEKKASQKLGSKKTEVKVRKVVVDGDTLVITVAPEDVGALVRMDGYGWAGVKVHIERLSGAKEDAPSSADLKAVFRSVLERRYNLELKLLDLSALGQDEELVKLNRFNTKSTTAKVFPAMMKVLELSFDTEAERTAAIESVSLANNELQDLKDVTALSTTLPKLHNLDLSNNMFDNLATLQTWSRRFHHLQHLIISGNPVEQNEPDYPAKIVKWYQNLRMLNNVQVRTEEEISSRAKTIDLPFPVRTANFQDEGGIAENFVRTFFVGFDSDRAGLAAHYYDDKSDFSFAVNTQAQRDPATSEHTEKQEWDQYIKGSRNLKKISQLPARQNRHFRGTKAVVDIFAALPKTKHPDLTSEARKWVIEAHIQPGVPELNGQSPNGVDGFMITVHGEFEELDAVTGQIKKKRSFDRTFIIGPGGPSGVRVVNDMLTIRAYGGFHAFEPDHIETWVEPAQAAPSLDAVPQLPAGLSIEMAEQMVAEVQKQTGMTTQYSKDCLEQVGWDFQKGLEAFANVKANLPSEAFAKPN